MGQAQSLLSGAEGDIGALLPLRPGEPPALRLGAEALVAALDAQDLAPLIALLPSDVMRTAATATLRWAKDGDTHAVADDLAAATVRELCFDCGAHRTHAVHCPAQRLCCHVLGILSKVYKGLGMS